MTTLSIAKCVCQCVSCAMRASEYTEKDLFNKTFLAGCGIHGGDGGGGWGEESKIKGE